MSNRSVNIIAFGSGHALAQQHETEFAIIANNENVRVVLQRIGLEFELKSNDREVARALLTLLHATVKTVRIFDDGNPYSNDVHERSLGGHSLNCECFECD